MDKTGLSEEDLYTYSRQIVLREIGYQGQERIRDAKVCVVGLGGLGCPAVLQLAAMGVGYLRIVDRDLVERSNLHRQYLYDTSQLGLPKVEAAMLKLEKLNPDVKLDPHPLSVDGSNAGRVVEGMDVVLDGLDNLKPRYAVNRACVEHNIPYVFAAAIETFGSVSTIIPGETSCLECFYSDIDEDLLPTCSVVGVHPSTTSIVSSLEVSEAVRVLVDTKPKLAGSLLFFDLSNIEFDRIGLKRREDCPACGESPAQIHRFRESIQIEEVCSRGGRRTFIAVPCEDLDLDLRVIQRRLERTMGMLSKRTKMSLAFMFKHRTRTTLLQSGVCILEGRVDGDAALASYRRIMEGLQLTGSRQS